MNRPKPKVRAEVVKHTPGPWFVGQYGWDIETDDHTGVAQTEAVGDNWRANAALISAAPELLDSCNALLAIVVDAIMHGMPVTPAVADARNSAIAAMNKAEGR